MGLKWYGDKVKKGIEDEVDRRMQKAAFLVVNQAVQNMRDTLTGDKQGKVTAASRPGSPPSVQTARLVNSVTKEKVAYLHYRIGTNIKYGLWLEIGTRIMAARPWLRRSLRDAARAIQNLFR